jgi:hypothetical protein
MVRPLIGNCGFEYAKAQLVPICLASVMGAVVALASNLYTLPHVAQLTVNVAIGACVYTGLIFAFYTRGVQELKLLVRSTEASKA